MEIRALDRAFSQVMTETATTAPTDRLRKSDVSAAGGTDTEKQHERTRESREQAVVERPRRRAYFAIDENRNVVIRIVDEEGNVIRQIPPEEFLKAAETLKENMSNLLDMEA